LTAPLLVIAAGGTGGHMFPAQALAAEMLARGWPVKLSTDARGARYAGGFPAEVVREVLRSASFARGGVLAKALVPVQIGLGIVGALVSMLRDRPACVAGFGGSPALPAMAAAWVLRVPRLIHEQNGVLGRVNRVFARRVNAVACGTWPTELPPGVEGLDIGNPVRGSIRAVAGAPYDPPGEDGPIHLLVFGGSQGARIMREVPEALAHLPGPLRARLAIAHQARDEDEEYVRTAYDALGLPADIRPFFDDMPEQLVKAQLVICRSGASTVADLSVVGRPSILIPFGAALRDEQTANARGLAEAGGAFVLAEDAVTPQVLAGHIQAILSDSEGAAAAAASAATLGKPDAAASLGGLVEALAGTRAA